MRNLIALSFLLATLVGCETASERAAVGHDDDRIGREDVSDEERWDTAGDTAVDTAGDTAGDDRTETRDGCGEPGYSDEDIDVLNCRQACHIPLGTSQSSWSAAQTACMLACMMDLSGDTFDAGVRKPGGGR